jgi:sugar phosphate isomerase/epimerase
MIGIATKFAPNQPAFETARQAGFRRVELWTDAGVLGRWREVVRLARSYSFDYALHFPNRLDQPPEVLDDTVALYRGLNARALVLHQPHYDRHGVALAERYPGIRLAVENHRLSHEQFLHWAAVNPGLALDVEHLWMFTLPTAPLSRILAEVAALLDRHAGKLYHVHLPGYLPGQEEHRPMYCSRDMVLGVLDLLERVRFEGLIVSEVNMQFQNIHDLTMDVLLFERWKLLRRPAT